MRNKMLYNRATFIQEFLPLWNNLVRKAKNANTFALKYHHKKISSLKSIQTFLPKKISNLFYPNSAKQFAAKSNPIFSYMIWPIGNLNRHRYRCFRLRYWSRPLLTHSQAKIRRFSSLQKEIRMKSKNDALHNVCHEEFPKMFSKKFLFWSVINNQRKVCWPLLLTNFNSGPLFLVTILTLNIAILPDSCWSDLIQSKLIIETILRFKDKSFAEDDGNVVENLNLFIFLLLHFQSNYQCIPLDIYNECELVIIASWWHS